MKKGINALMAFTIISLATASCTMGDKDKSAETTVATDTSMMNKGAVADTQMNTTATTTTPAATDSMSMMKKTEGAMAKPNPAKKGMKGKVSIVMADKAAGDMEMMDKEGYYTNVYPNFPGGQKALEKYFENNIQYPADAQDNGIEGTVNISFAVDEKGKMSGAKIANAPLGYGLEDEAMRVFKKMPTWTAGSLKGKNVKTRYTLPVRFQLF